MLLKILTYDNSVHLRDKNSTPPKGFPDRRCMHIKLRNVLINKSKPLNITQHANMSQKHFKKQQ